MNVLKFFVWVKQETQTGAYVSYDDKGFKKAMRLTGFKSDEGFEEGFIDIAEHLKQHGFLVGIVEDYDHQDFDCALSRWKTLKKELILQSGAEHV